ncbi:MAG TPA: S8 family serine peptidase [Polyangia bacterium]|jgi:hypothetical protein|nr:S8 family serine peptidase [Polyangia bacterium]
MNRPPWDFDYRPVNAGTQEDDAWLDDLILASEGPVDPVRLTELLGQLAPDLRVEPVLDWHPLYWTRVRAGCGIEPSDCERRLRAGGVAVRYLASTQAGSQRLPPALDLRGCLPMRPIHWRARGPSVLDENASAGRWFVGENGVEVHRPVCGAGAGTRLAAIDNDAGEVGRLDLDDHIPVGVAEVPAGSSHAAQLVAWAVRAVGGQGPNGGAGFIGIAPDASPRLYSIPKPGNDVLSFPLAVVRAVADGADVVVCATNVDGQWSPMLDDALELACRLGRNGLGTAVVLPCGRETSSPEGSAHSSLSLGAGDPAGDPRVFCVAPSGRDGGWFLWRDHRGQLHPFANRGPALRWLAPGDDVALPFHSPEILAHAESSGASAMAAGVLLLVLGRNPDLTLPELEDALTRTVREVDPELSAERSALADKYDILPVGRDRDGHNAKHGYGLLHASRACLLVSDPIAFALVSIGEDQAAVRWVETRNEQLASLYSSELGRWAVRVLLADAGQRHAVCALARLLRLLAVRAERLHAQAAGALLRLVMMLLRDLPRSRQAPAPEAALQRELLAIADRVKAATSDPARAGEIEEHMCTLAAALWPAVGSHPVAPERHPSTHAVERLGA